MNAHNPITNVRTFGSDPQRVEACGRAYIRGAQSAGCATAAKHFPGDGVDERDQHLLTSINTLSVQDWDATFGKVYAGMIEEGTLSIMAGQYRPSRLCQGVGRDGTGGRSARHAFPVLISRLLREKTWLPGSGHLRCHPHGRLLLRHEARGRGTVLYHGGLRHVPLQQGFAGRHRIHETGPGTGVLTEARLEEAVIRILGLKAALGLHEKQERHALIPSGEAQRVIGCRYICGWLANAQMHR